MTQKAIQRLNVSNSLLETRLEAACNQQAVEFQVWCLLIVVLAG